MSYCHFTAQLDSWLRDQERNDADQNWIDKHVEEDLERILDELDELTKLVEIAGKQHTPIEFLSRLLEDTDLSINQYLREELEYYYAEKLSDHKEGWQ